MITKIVSVDVLNEEQLLKIHNALHDDFVWAVEINGIMYRFTVNDDGIRQVTIDNTTFVPQDYKKEGPYGDLARAGFKITWGKRPKRSQWALIIADKVKHL